MTNEWVSNRHPHHASTAPVSYAQLEREYVHLTPAADLGIFPELRVPVPGDVRDRLLQPCATAKIFQSSKTPRYQLSQ